MAHDVGTDYRILIHYMCMHEPRRTNLDCYPCLSIKRVALNTLEHSTLLKHDTAVAVPPRLEQKSQGLKEF